MPTPACCVRLGVVAPAAVRRARRRMPCRRAGAAGAVPAPRASRILTVALGALLGAACGPSRDPDASDPAGRRSLGDRLVSVTRAPRPPRTLWRLGDGALERAWVVDRSPGSLRLEEASIERTADGALRLPGRRETERGPRTARHLIVPLDVDPGATIRVTGTLRVSPRRAGAEGPRGPHVLEVVQLGSRPRAAADVLRTLAKRMALASRRPAAVEQDGAWRIEAEVDVFEGALAMVVVAGPTAADGHRDAELVALAIEDTGRRRPAPATFEERVADAEARDAIVLVPEAEAVVCVPPAGADARLELGVAPLPRPGAARVELILSRDEALLDGTTLDVGPPRGGRRARRWRDVALALPAGGPATLRIVATGDDPRPSAVLVSEPVMRPERPAPATPERPNLLLVSIDTLRADGPGFAGGHPDASPALDALARRGTVFEACVAPAAYTLPSHVSMLSGQQPTVHGVLLSDGHIVEERTTLLAEVCHEAGLSTAAFTGGGYLDRRYGYSRGFERYSQRDDLLHGDEDPVDWIRAHADERFFVFLHTFIVHEAAWLDEPYLSRFDAGCEAPELHVARGKSAELVAAMRDEGLSEAARAHLRRCYAGATRQADDALAPVLAALEELGLRGRTLVVVTSDHGQEIGERGTYGHGHSLYDEMLRVPLVLAGPCVPAGARIEAQVGLIDLAPTVLQLMELPAPSPMQGRSLVPLLRGRPLPPRPLVAELHRASALRWPSRKVIADGRAGGGEDVAWELYDLSRDARERVDLSGDTARLRPAADTLGRRLEALEALAETLDAAHGTGSRELTEREIERLRALGYLGG